MKSIQLYTTQLTVCTGNRPLKKAPSSADLRGGAGPNRGRSSSPGRASPSASLIILVTCFSPPARAAPSSARFPQCTGRPVNAREWAIHPYNTSAGRAASYRRCSANKARETESEQLQVAFFFASIFWSITVRAVCLARRENNATKFRQTFLALEAWSKLWWWNNLAKASRRKGRGGWEERPGLWLLKIDEEFWRMRIEVGWTFVENLMGVSHGENVAVVRNTAEALWIFIII